MFDIIFVRMNFWKLNSFEWNFLSNLLIILNFTSLTDFQKSERQLGIYLKLRPDGSKIVGHDERSSEDRPNGHLNFRLVQTQAIVSDDQLKHWITVPCMNTRRKMFRIHILQNELHIMSTYFWLGFLLYIFLGILKYWKGVASSLCSSSCATIRHFLCYFCFSIFTSVYKLNKSDQHILFNHIL